VSLTLVAGTWTVLAGVSGAGKSTLLRAIAGLHGEGASPAHGAVMVQDQNLWRLPPAERAQRMGLVLQAPDDQLCATTAEGEIAFGLCNLCWSTERIARQIEPSLETAGLSGVRDIPVAQLSGGQKQKLALAAIGAMAPEVLLLDEPLSQLDPQAAREFLKQLDTWRNAGGTILMAEHRLDEVLPFADAVLAQVPGGLLGPVGADDVPALDQLCRVARVRAPDLVCVAKHAGLPTWKHLMRVSNRPEVLTAGEALRTEEVTSHSKATLLTVSDLELRFEPKGPPVWTDVNLAVLAGDVIALMGPNGAGKSSLLATMAGLIRLGRGRVDVSVERGRAKVGLVPQNPDLSLFCSTVREELAFGPRRQGIGGAALEACVRETSEGFGLTSLLDAPPLGLSQGERLRTAVAAMVALRPAILLLDEPTTGQDPTQVERLMELLGGVVRRGEIGALVFVTHDLRTVLQSAARLWLLAEGEVVADTVPMALLDRSDWRTRARLTLPPLWEFRRREALSGTNVHAIANEWKARCSA